MIVEVYDLHEDPAVDVPVGVAIVFEDGAVFVRRWDTDAPRLYDSLDDALAEHTDCKACLRTNPVSEALARLMPAGMGGVDPARVREGISEVCRELETISLEKNRAYGNSVLDPVRVFSRLTPIEGACARVDDKLSRLTRGYEYPGDDTVRDLIGYLILILVGRRLGVE